MAIALVAGLAAHYAGVLAHEAAHAGLLWIFFSDRGRVTVRVTVLGAGCASLTGWAGLPPTRRDLRRYAVAQLAGPLVTLAASAALLAIGLALLDGAPAAPASWRTALGVTSLSVVLANLCALAICCSAPGHDVWLMRAALRAARIGDASAATLQQAIAAHAARR